MSKKPAAPVAETDEAPPRHADINQRTGAEHRIYGAIEKVRALGDNPLTVKAIDHLTEALNLVAAHTDQTKK